LAILRAKKYSIPKATKLAKHLLLSINNFPQYFKDLDVTNPTIKDVLETGFLLLMPGKDKDGCKVSIYRLGAIDPKNILVNDLFRFEAAVVELTLITEEETQIAGSVNIFDFTSFPKSLLTFLSFSDIKNMIYLLGNVLPVRLKGIYIVGLPSFASQLFEWGTGFMHKKLKERLKFLKDYEELRKIVDVELLPTEFGGKVSSQEMIRNLGENLLRSREDILRTNDVEIDAKLVCKSSEAESVQQKDMGTQGTFRMLEFD
jgi:hypothetical protein